MIKKNDLKGSKMWQLATKIAEQVRETVKTVPYDEHYNLAFPAIQSASTLTSDVAYALGKEADTVSYDFNVARGHLYTVKSLLLQAQKYGYVQTMDNLLADMNELQLWLDQRADELKDKDEMESKNE